MSNDAVQLDKIKKAFAKMGIQYDTDEEYEEAIDNLVRYFDLLIEMEQQQKEDEKSDQIPSDHNLNNR